MNRVIPLVPVLLLFATCAIAQPEPKLRPITVEDAPPAAVDNSSSARLKKKRDKQAVVCQSTTVIGSRQKRTVCATREHWETRQRAGQEVVESVQREPKGNL